MARIEIPAGVRTRIYRRYSNSLPETIRFDAAAGTGPPTGSVEVEGPRLRRKRPAQPLRAENVVEKSMWDSKFSIFVTPDTDTEITLHKRVADGVPRLAMLIGGVAVIGLIAALIPLLLR